MNEKGKIISEKDVENLALNLYKENIKQLQEKEKFIINLPYSDEYPRLLGSKHLTCHAIIIRGMYISVGLALSFGFVASNYRYSI